MLSQLSHPNILLFYGVYHNSNIHQVGMVFPWMENGNLREYLKAHPGALRLPFVSNCPAPPYLLVRNFFQVHDISAGVQYLHQHQIVYNHLCGVRLNELVSYPE